MNYYPNTHITTLKSRLWGKVLETIGEEPMLDLLLNTSIFLQLNQENDVSKSNYYQLAGEFLGRGEERISAFFFTFAFFIFFFFILSVFRLLLFLSWKRIAGNPSWSTRN